MPPDQKDKRRARRVKLRQPVHIRPFDQRCSPEVSTTINLSRDGIYFETSLGHYFAGMDIYLTRNFDPADPLSHEEIGEVVRVERLPNGKWGIAVRVYQIKAGQPSFA
jgi:hypothetical protein